MVEHWRNLLNSIIAMKSVKFESPAKINLMLSVHGQRDDGFHSLTSVVASLVFGDTLIVSLNEAGVDRLNCSDSAVPTGHANLILKAAVAFREELGENIYFDFDLDKRIPMGAGLGGGSSNAAVALCAMNQLRGNCMTKERLRAVATELGSDCPFFIDSIPSKMSGRGEVLEACLSNYLMHYEDRGLFCLNQILQSIRLWPTIALANRDPRFMNLWS